MQFKRFIMRITNFLIVITVKLQSTMHMSKWLEYTILNQGWYILSLIGYKL